MASACNSNIYDPKRLVLYFLHAKIKRKLAIVRKSQEKRIPKKIQYHLSFEQGRQPLQTPGSANFTK